MKCVGKLEVPAGNENTLQMCKQDGPAVTQPLGWRLAVHKIQGKIEKRRPWTASVILVYRVADRCCRRHLELQSNA